MIHRTKPQMQAVGSRMTREQHLTLKQLRKENGFEGMHSNAFLSLMRLLHQGGRSNHAPSQFDGFKYSIQRILE